MKGPKKATDRRRQYKATAVKSRAGGAPRDTNGAGPPISFFHDRRGPNGSGKRAS